MYRSPREDEGSTAARSAPRPSHHQLTPDDSLDHTLESERRERAALRSALTEAVLQDFLDDLPVPVRPRDLAIRLLYPLRQVYSEIQAGRLTAAPLKQGTRLLTIDVQNQGNRAWIAWALATRYQRASRGLDSFESVPVLISNPATLAQLSVLAATGMSANDAVERALASFNPLGRL